MPRMRSGCCARALRGNDPVIFFEHRAMLDDSWARRPWPGDAFVVPFGKAKKTRDGDQITIVTWGAMVPRCEAAAEGISADVIDLRTLNPWDRDMVLDSVRRTRRCLIVHEDLRTGGFGAEIAAVVADEAFLDLDAPVARVTMPDIPSPHHPEPARMGGAVASSGSAPRSTGWWGSDEHRGARSRRAGGDQGGRARVAEARRRCRSRSTIRWSSSRPTR